MCFFEIEGSRVRDTRLPKFHVWTSLTHVDGSRVRGTRLPK